MTLSEIRTEFGQRAPDSPATTTQQDIWANEGARDIARRTKFNRTSGSISLVASTQSYDLISNFTTFVGIDPDGGVAFYDGTNYKELKATSEDFLDKHVADWRNANEDEPIAYYKKGKDIYLYPTPSSNWTNGLLVNYFAKPTEMTGDTDDPFDDRTDLEPYHDLVVTFMVWKAKQSMGEYAQADVARKEYLQGVEQMNLDLWENLDDQEGFRPYHKMAVQTHSHPNLWGVE